MWVLDFEASCVLRVWEFLSTRLRVYQSLKIWSFSDFRVRNTLCETQMKFTECTKSDYGRKSLNELKITGFWLFFVLDFLVYVYTLRWNHADFENTIGNVCYTISSKIFTANLHRDYLLIQNQITNFIFFPKYIKQQSTYKQLIVALACGKYGASHQEIIGTNRVFWILLAIMESTTVK